MSVESVWFRRVLWAQLAVLVLAVSWLFASNLDTLFPAGGPFAGGILSRADFWRSLNLSVLSATATALVAALLGIPAAWALSRRTLAWHRGADILLGAILALPASSVGLALVLLFQYGPLDWLQAWLGVRVIYTLPGILVAQLVLALALGLQAWRAAFEALDPRLELTARTLGANSFQAFWRVALPAARPGILAGLVLAWLRAMAEFGAVLLFCSTFRELPASRFGELARWLHVDRADLLAVAMWVEIEFGRVEAGMGMAFALAMTCAACVYLVRLNGGRIRGH